MNPSSFYALAENRNQSGNGRDPIFPLLKLLNGDLRKPETFSGFRLTEAKPLAPRSEVLRFHLVAHERYFLKIISSNTSYCKDTLTHAIQTIKWALRVVCCRHAAQTLWAYRAYALRCSFSFSFSAPIDLFFERSRDPNITNFVTSAVKLQQDRHEADYDPLHRVK